MKSRVEGLYFVRKSLTRGIQSEGEEDVVSLELRNRWKS